jgi:hypothetical protein
VVVVAVGVVVMVMVVEEVAAVLVVMVMEVEEAAADPGATAPTQWCWFRPDRGPVDKRLVFGVEREAAIRFTWNPKPRMKLLLPGAFGSIHLHPFGNEPCSLLRMGGLCSLAFVPTMKDQARLFFLPPPKREGVILLPSRRLPSQTLLSHRIFDFWDKTCRGNN